VNPHPVVTTPRELPAHRTMVFSRRSQDYALVIPVLNEGERIRAQLKQLQGMALPIDMVIADGNSTDGSLDEAVLRRMGIRALLVKTGPGRLSAQLRMAYAWCLDEGYEGIVTVDGNGKDGLEAISRFIDLLRDGYDYVQGSRYIRGGQAVNTPVDRYLAGRFIHAPLVSFAAGRRLTDTTNGFRGYSRRALEDSRVQPFRDVFTGYALLFYLSVRLPQLGFRTTETPVRRYYPPGKQTPTKIHGLAGKARLLVELLAVVRGKFDPGDKGGSTSVTPGLVGSKPSQ
jgi:dolichol-phosphate mannosyltransferase